MDQALRSNGNFVGSAPILPLLSSETTALMRG
jgi:hypothetical protein